ncbi:LytR/AlgR family response regulator transcription factor [Carboxylicivirga sp. RSCT41]|uniref:LytR/AlgR family response regulator transcription factor n=1 Tax=Carboxylicivirga agarovorans TaxID=3417570 RepID=UPI003D34D481
MIKECKQGNQVCYFKKLDLLLAKGQYRLVEPKDILYLQADRSYCKVHLLNGEVLVASKPLNRFEKKLCAGKFLRSHRSYLINKVHVSGFSRNDKMIRLAEGIELPCSERALKELIKELVL